jgi:hypothetical protein
MLVRYAINSGRLKRPKRCEICKNKNKVDAHHEDYLKPLEVNWLCRHCHTKLHRGVIQLDI